MMPKSKVAIIMPVYNEADTIENTINEIENIIIGKMGFIDLWVFEDGSTDGTKEILRKLENEVPNLQVRMEEERKGYPRAMKEAFLAIRPEEYEYVMTIDSDGQYDPYDFFQLWEVMNSESPDIVMGKRAWRAEPFWRRFLSWGARALEGFMFPLPCEDVTSVMRLMRVETARDIAREMKYSEYNFWLEFTARMALKGYEVIELPVAYREREGGSRVYSIKKMPKILISEFKALRDVKNEWKNKGEAIENAHNIRATDETRLTKRRGEGDPIVMAKRPVDWVVVCDDGSVDLTGEIAGRLFGVAVLLYYRLLGWL